MVYFIGILLGYYARIFFNWLKELAEIKLPDHYVREDWDWQSTDDIQ